MAECGRRGIVYEVHPRPDRDAGKGNQPEYIAIPVDARPHSTSIAVCPILSKQAEKILISLTTRTWVTSAERLQDIGSQSRVKRFAKFEIDARAIADVITEVTRSIHSFTVRNFRGSGREFLQLINLSRLTPCWLLSSPLMCDIVHFRGVLC
jgi:hypothetical protein